MFEPFIDQIVSCVEETIYLSSIKVSQLFDSPNLMKILQISTKTRDVTRVVDGVQFGDLIEFVDMDFVNHVAKVNGAPVF
jgi:hypothetical protein